jgi:hypothetical protein
MFIRGKCLSELHLETFRIIVCRFFRIEPWCLTKPEHDIVCAFGVEKVKGNPAGCISFTPSPFNVFIG